MYILQCVYSTYSSMYRVVVKNSLQTDAMISLLQQIQPYNYTPYTYMYEYSYNIYILLYYTTAIPGPIRCSPAP